MTNNPEKPEKVNPEEDSSREYLIRELRRFAEENGRIPRRDDLRRCEGYSSKEKYYKVFGSWTDAVHAAFHSKDSSDLVEEDNQEEEQKDNVSYTGFTTAIFEESLPASEPDTEPVPECEAEQVPEFEDTQEKTVEEKPEREFLIEELQRFERENNRLPMLEDMKKSNGYPSKKRYKKEFKSWEKALKAAFQVKRCVFLIGTDKNYLIDEKSKYIETPSGLVNY